MVHLNIAKSKRESLKGLVGASRVITFEMPTEFRGDGKQATARFRLLASN